MGIEGVSPLCSYIRKLTDRLTFVNSLNLKHYFGGYWCLLFSWFIKCCLNQNIMVVWTTVRWAHKVKNKNRTEKKNIEHTPIAHILKPVQSPAKQLFGAKRWRKKKYSAKVIIVLFFSYIVSIYMVWVFLFFFFFSSFFSEICLPSMLMNSFRIRMSMISKHVFWPTNRPTALCSFF